MGWGVDLMAKAPQSHDETVARMALSRMVGEARIVSGMRGMPPNLRYATPEEEDALFDEWDDAVDPRAVLAERLQKHLADGQPPDVALTEAVLETCAAGFKNRLKMAQGGGRITLTEQVRYLEAKAAKRMQAAPPMGVSDGELP
jgi:hypothetical protein